MMGVAVESLTPHRKRLASGWIYPYRRRMLYDTSPPPTLTGAQRDGGNLSCGILNRQGINREE